jgi:hypothetical protein
MKACISPFQLSGGKFVPCGRCRHCRRLNQKTWATRIMLESFYHPASVFGTLTYNDDNVPLDETGTPMLDWADATGFIERLRHLTKHDKPLRYFLVGEYGSETWRPHYHFIIFGQGVNIEPLVSKAWTNKTTDIGFTQVGPLTMDRALYIANYCIKKLTKEHDPALKGRVPEFARMSLKPAIGTPAVGWLADRMGKSSLMENGQYGPLLKLQGDVFNMVRIQGRLMPLGRTLRNKVRDSLGLSQNERERAIQLGRFDASTGEIFEPCHPAEFYPMEDLSDAKTPWRLEIDRQVSKLKTERAQQAHSKEDRQANLGLTTGGRL